AAALLVGDLPVVEQDRQRMVGIIDNVPVDRDVVNGDTGHGVLSQPVRGTRGEVLPEEFQVSSGQRLIHALHSSSLRLARVAPVNLAAQQTIAAARGQLGRRRPRTRQLRSVSNGRKESSTAASSIVEGTGSARPSAMPRMVLRRILPERVLGSAATTSTWRSAATGPIWSLTSATSSSRSPGGSAPAPALSTTKARGTCPLIVSLTPITAHSATAGWLATTSSISPVDSQWPATFITSSVRPMTNSSPSTSRKPPSSVR